MIKCLAKTEEVRSPKQDRANNGWQERNFICLLLILKWLQVDCLPHYAQKTVLFFN